MPFIERIMPNHLPIANPLVVALVYDGLCVFEFGIVAEVFALPRARFDALAAEHGELAVALLRQLTRSLATRLRTAVGEVQALRG